MRHWSAREGPEATCYSYLDKHATHLIVHSGWTQARDIAAGHDCKYLSRHESQGAALPIELT
jgi:hypothetical protein